jgi:indole-3-glycerol phosphate synthase
MSILAEILERKVSEVAEARAARPLAELEARAQSQPATRDFEGALRRGPGQPIRLIAEYKRASPSAGMIRDDLEVEDVARAYAEAGASAMSVLTDEHYFKGHLDFLARARAVAEIPLLRKDFIVDGYQVVEARAAGADAILLIVAAVDDGQLRELLAQAGELGLAALVEVHSKPEAERALAAGARIVGVNHRDLRTFEIHMELTAELRSAIGEDVILVGESGIRGRKDVQRLASDGAHAVLVGEQLMRAESPAQAVRDLLQE